MAEMFFEDYPSFKEIIKKLAELEDEIHKI